MPLMVLGGRVGIDIKEGVGAQFMMYKITGIRNVYAKC